MGYIAYRSGYKYQLAEDCLIRTSICPERPVLTPFYSLTTTGVLLIRAGYAWDGPSGPTIDTASSMRGALVHDVLYQMMRLEQLDRLWRPWADDLFRAILIEDDMFKWRADAWHRAVRTLAGPAADPRNAKPVHIAPKKKRSVT